MTSLVVVKFTFVRTFSERPNSMRTPGNRLQYLYKMFDINFTYMPYIFQTIINLGVYLNTCVWIGHKIIDVQTNNQRC